MWAVRSVSEPVTMAMFGDSSIYQGRMTSMLVALFDIAQFESGMVFRGFAGSNEARSPVVQAICLNYPLQRDRFRISRSTSD